MPEKRGWHRWSQAEDHLITDSTLSTADIAARLGLTANVVKNRAHYLRKSGRYVPNRRSSGALSGWKRRTSPNSFRDDNGCKVCKNCSLHLPPSAEFWSGHKSTSDRLQPHCKRCRSDRHHHLTIDLRWDLLTAQRYTCAFPECPNRLELFGKNTYHIDHNHDCCGRKDSQGTAPTLSCGVCIRGLLCRRCNILLRCDIEPLLRRIPEINAYLRSGDRSDRTLPTRTELC